MYANMKRSSAIMPTTAAMIVIIYKISALFPLLLPLKATATFPMTREIEGKMAPASTEAKVPNEIRNLSCVVRYEKNFTNLI
jgi:hypothetical protein